MKLFMMALAPLSAMTLDSTAAESGHHHHHRRHRHHPKQVKTERMPPTHEQRASADAVNAHRAADSAQAAADVATKVAAHTVSISVHAQKALDHAEDALHLARVEGQGLSKDQRESLRKSERKVGKAIETQGLEKKRAQLKADQNQDAEIKKQLQKKAEAAAIAKAKTDAKKADTAENSTKATQPESDLIQMKSELQGMAEDLRQMREGRGEAEKWDLEVEIHDLEDMIEKLQAEEAKKAPEDRPQSHDELKAEVERLREAVDQLKAQGGPPQKQPEATETTTTAEPRRRPRPARLPTKKSTSSDEESTPVDITPAEEPVRASGIDVDTEMPYGELEPFGREDTAQELTESSVRESDEMVDQLERAEVAEEKRSVFRALTRLRGAAITSFDGVARSQTGNIDEYNKIHKWRTTHPLHHLADEESDISKWAFPDNADF